MDHYELGQAAFEKRQLSEAEAHFARITDSLQPDQLIHLHVMRFEISKALRVDECWRDLKKLSEIYYEQNFRELAQEVLEHNRKLVPKNFEGFVFELLAKIHFEKGELAQSRTNATSHVNHLLEKKLSSHLAGFAHQYQLQFPQTLYFSFMKLQANVLLEDVKGAEAAYQHIVETIHRRWSRVEDNNNASKEELLSTATEAIKALDMSNGEAVLLAHYSQLTEKLFRKEKLAKEDWKKLIELVVDEDSWKRLKLALELAINNDETDIALEVHASLKRKRGFSFVKLTKYDSLVKEWLLNHTGNRSVAVEKDSKESLLTLEDLKLEDENESKDISPVELAELSEDEKLEQRSIELNAIKQLSLHQPSVEVALELLVTYRTLGFNKVVGWLLETYASQAQSSVLEKKFSYFRVLNAIDLKQHFNALAIIEEMLGDQSLTLDELKELKYVQGSLLANVGRKKEAMLSFKEVERLDPAYRQLRERMQRI